MPSGSTSDRPDLDIQTARRLEQQVKLKTPLVVLDLEATKDHQEIIDIGAVLLDRQLEVVDEFSQLVNPGRPLCKFIVDLTGIDDEMLADAPTFVDAAKAFETWIESHFRIKKTRLVAWGTYFDIPLLRRVYANNDRPYPYAGTAIDVKSLAFLWAALSHRPVESFTVEKMAAWMSIETPAKMHRGIVDARAEAAILKRVIGDFRNGCFLEVGHAPVHVELNIR